MAAIYRLLCTHCTFGTSALESSTADNAAKVFGYSVRRSSLPDSDRVQLRTVFRAVERLLSYYLPKDAPAEKKESLDAHCTPRRLVFLPNLGGWQAAAHVAYRTRDTAGRPGCYFADVLAAKSDGGKSLWSPLDVLQLWSTRHDDVGCANWWCVSEEALAQLDESGNGELRSLTTPTELRENAAPFLDDNLLSQFLNLESGTAPDDPGHVVAPRWWAMPVLQRRALMEAVLGATINTRKHNSKEAIVIAAEPSVAALLFYGVFRLLPEKLGTGIGFSTYESSPERSLTPLVATTFHDPEAPNADLPTELYSRGFACNTFRDVAKYGRAQPVSEVGYVRHVVGLAATGNWAALDGFLAALNALQKPDFGSLDKMTEIETYVTDYVTGNKRRKKIGPEPSVERGSDKERFRRARFRGLLTTGAEDRAADWPGDLLRTAVAWLGEEFPELWTEQGPVASVLQKRLPATNKELELLLRKVQDSPESTRTRLNHMVARAVIHVALAEHAEQIPQAFSDFIAAPTKDGGHAPPIPKAGDFVEALLGELVAQGHQSLLRSPSRQLVGPILDAVSAHEKRSAGFVHEQRIPLLDILTWSLTNTHTSTKDRADFLTRHDALERLIRQCVCPREFTAAVDNFFGQLLRLAPGTKQTNWDFLAADGRSRAKVLANWLSAVKPENKSRYKEALEAWQAIHTAVSQLKPVAEKAGRFKALFPKLFPSEQPPRASLTNFTDAYGQLREVHQACNTPIDLPLGAFLANSFNGLAVNEPERPRMTRWLDRALSDATRARSLAFAKLRGKKKASVKGKALRLGLAAALVLVCGGLAFGLYKQALKNPTISKLLAGRSSAGQRKTAGPKSAPDVEKAPQRQATDGADVPPSRVTTSPTTPKKDTPKPQPVPLTKQTLALSGTITSGTLAIRWNGDAVKQSGETLGIKVTREGEAVATLAPSGINSVEIALSKYGAYSVTAEAQANEDIPLLSTWGPTTFAPPPAPVISATEVVVNPEGKPVFRATIKQPDLSAYSVCFYSLSGTTGKIGDTPTERLEAHECTIQISLGDRKPADVLRERFTFRLITSAGEGSPIENLTLKPTTNVTEALQAKLTAREQHGVYVCALPDAYPKEPVTVLELPWFIDDSKDVSQLLLLRPKYVVYTGVAAPITPTIIADPTNATRWKCGIEGGSETGTGIGFFEVIRPADSPWRPILRFVPNKLGDEQTIQAYAQLQMCKLCLSVGGKMVATAQLVEPRKMGPMVLAIKKPIEELGFALPRLIASFDLDAAAIPAAWVPADMSPKLPVAFSTQRGSVKQDRCAVHLRPLDPDEKSIQGYKAWVVAGTDALESRSGLTFKKADRKKVEFRISGDWQWKRADGKDKTKLEPVATDLGDICRTVEDFEECQKEIDRASQAARHAEEEAGKAKDDKKKESLQKEKTEAEANKKRYQARLDELRPSYEINRPYHDLIVTLTSDELQVPEWTMEWNVGPDSGTDVPPTIPGTLTVIGVVGSGKGGVPLRFERDPKWEAPKKKK